jgi:hypothetical protein
MRKLAFAAWAALPAVVAFGCTSILGDFTSGTGGPVSGLDATTLDGPVTGDDAAVDANGSAPDGGQNTQGEAGPDTGTAPPKLLTCGEDMNARVNLSLNPNGGGPVSLDYDTVAVASLNGGNGDARIIVAESNKIHAYTYTQNGGSVVDAVFQLGQNGNGPTQVLDIQRYPGGFACLVMDVSPTNEPVLAIVRISDTSLTTWPNELIVSAPNFVQLGGGTSGNNNNLKAVLGVLNASTNDFYIAVYDNENGMDVLRAERVTAGGYPGLTTLGMFTTGTYSLPSPAFAFNANNSYILLQASGNNGGPTSPNSAVYTLPPSNFGNSGVANVLTPPIGNTLFALAMANSGVMDGSANLAFIEGNLSTFALNYYVGQVPMSGLGTLAWQNLTVTSPPETDAGTSVEDLPVNLNALHYESFSPSEALLAISTTQTVTTDFGLNFIWWDAQTGYMRANQTGQTRLLSDVTTPTLSLHRSNVTFLQPPSVVSRFRIVYELETPQGSGNNSSGPGSLWTTSITCQP